MIPLGLSASEHAKFLDALRGTHSIHVTVQICNLSGDRLSDISDRLLDGQVNVDVGTEPTRTCTMSLLDPNRRLPFDPDSPADGAVFLDRMIRVVYSVRVDTVGWVDVPVFTGPVSKVDRQDDVVSVECQGKEVLAMGAAWQTRTYKKGRDKVNTIRAILRDLAGETRFDFPDLKARLPKDLGIGHGSVPWHLARKIAASMDRQIYYDGRGVCRLRPQPNKSVFTFDEGDGGVLTSYPQVSYSSEGLVNIVLVNGGRVKAAWGGAAAQNNVPVHGYYAAPRSHPLSPQRLGRRLNDGTLVPRYLLETVQNSNIVRSDDCVRLAKTILERKLLQSTDVTFDSLPIPHLDPDDLFRVVTTEFTTHARLRQFSLPLKTGDSMSVGYMRRVSVHRRPKHRR